MKKHNIFPVEIYTFENTDLVDLTLDALDPIERGMFNLPSTVQTTRGNLHTLPQFKPLFDWIHLCLDEIQKAEEYEMYGRFEVSLAWGNVSFPESGGHHQPHHLDDGRLFIRHARHIGLLHRLLGVDAICSPPTRQNAHVERKRLQ